MNVLDADWLTPEEKARLVAIAGDDFNLDDDDADFADALASAELIRRIGESLVPDPSARCRWLDEPLGFGGQAALADGGPAQAGAPVGADAPDQVDRLAERLAAQAQPHIDGWVGQVRAMTRAAGSLEELAAMIEAAYPTLDSGPLADTLTQAGLAAELGGRADVLDEIPGDTP